MRRFRQFPATLVIFILIVLLLVANSVDVGPRHFYYVEHPLVRLLTERSMDSGLDSLPVYRYKRVRDSIRNGIQEENMSLILGGSGWQTLSFGTSSYEEKDSTQYFLTFRNYWTDNGPTAFYRKGGRSYMEYTDDSGFIKTKESEVLFTSRDGSDGKLMIPTSKSTIRLFTILQMAFVILTLVAAFYLLLVTPLRILFNIAKGKVFTDENIGGLHAVSWTLMVLGLVPGLVGVLSHLLIRSQIPPGVSFRFWDTIMAGSPMFVAGLCTLLLAKAFLKGSQLQNEQELTV